MNYDEAISKAESIVKELEQTQALSVQAYKEKATQVKELLNYCENQLKEMQKDMECSVS